MSKNRLLTVGLVFAVGVLVVAALVGWWWVKLYDYPFLFPVPAYRLTANYYIAEFQPIYLWEHKAPIAPDEDAVDPNQTWAKVLYRNSEGKWVTTELFMRGEMKDNEGKAFMVENPINKVKFMLPGTRIKVEYLLGLADGSVDELGEYCEKSKRLCQMAGLAETSYTLQTMTVLEGMEPPTLVPVLEINKDLKTD